MKVNDKELFEYSIGDGDKNGRVNHKIYSSSSSKEINCKERWLKLKGNLLFFYKINEYGGLNDIIPHRFLLLELFKVKQEFNEILPFSFSLVFEAEPEKKHVFSCVTQTALDEWIKLLKEASYQSIKQKVRNLQKYLLHKTRKDPLLRISNLPFNLSRPID